MNRGPMRGRTAVDHVATATTAWAGEPPEWIVALAEKAREVGQRKAGELVGYSGTTISEAISNKYRGDLGRLEQMVRGALLGAAVHCPGRGTAIGIDRCRTQQKQPFSSASPMAVRLARACRTCSNREVKS